MRGWLTLLRAAYVLASELWDEGKRERARQTNARASREAAMASAVAHQKMQEVAAINKVIRLSSRKAVPGR